MSLIEKLDSVLASRDTWALATFLRDHGPAIRQDMIDARRYRWLRDPNRRIGSVIDKVTGHLESGFPIYEYRAGEELDAAIDARLASDSEGGE